MGRQAIRAAGSNGRALTSLTQSRSFRTVFATTQTAVPWTKTFREAFCARFACAAENYERRVFWRALHRRCLPLAALIYALAPRYFELDLQAIRQLGLATSSAEFRAEIDSFRSDYRMSRHWLKNSQRLRIRARGSWGSSRTYLPPLNRHRPVVRVDRL